jgi:hypothetical protein
MKPVVICFGCRRRLSEVELISGQHNHIDERERLQAQAETKRTS